MSEKGDITKVYGKYIEFLEPSFTRVPAVLFYRYSNTLLWVTTGYIDPYGASPSVKKRELTKISYNEERDSYYFDDGKGFDGSVEEPKNDQERNAIDKWYDYLKKEGRTPAEEWELLKQEVGPFI